MRRFVCVFLVLFIFPILAKAAAPAWQMVPKDSTITFTATQNNSPVSGVFKTFSSEINFDPSALDSSSVKITVDTGSVSTSYKEVGETLKAPEWFDVKIFPQAIFTANHFTKTGDKTYKAEGTLTIRDKTVPVVLTFNLEEYSATKARVKGETSLKRTQFGVGSGDWAKTDEVKDDVKVEFTLVATKK